MAAASRLLPKTFMFGIHIGLFVVGLYSRPYSRLHGRLHSRTFLVDFIIDLIVDFKVDIYSE